MRRKVMVIMVLIISFSFVSCKQYIKGRYEVDKLIYIRVIAFDKGENENIKATIISRSVSASGGGQRSETKKANIISSEGSTIAEAIGKLSLYSDKIPFFGHIEYILFGEELAKEGILPYIDYISRGHEMRINAKVYLVKTVTAQELLEKTNTADLFFGERLSNLEDASGKMSFSSEVPLSEVMFIMDSPFLSLYVPTIEMTKVINKTDENEKFDILLGGYSVFKDDKLIGHLSMYSARGLNWLRNLIDSGVIVVNGLNGEKVSLDIIVTNTKVVPVISSNGDLKATVNVELNTNISEIYGTQNVFVDESLEFLQKQQNEVVRNEIQGVIDFAKENKIDFFSLGTRFFQKYPLKWSDYEKNWNELISDIDFEVKVESVIKRSYLLSQPTRQGRR